MSVNSLGVVGQPEFEFRVGNDDAARLGMRHSARIDLQRQVAQAADQIVPDNLARLGLADVLVVAGVGFGRGREDRRGQPIRFPQAGRKRQPQTVPVCRYSFQPEPERYPRATHSTGSGVVLRTSIDRPDKHLGVRARRRRKIVHADGHEMMRRQVRDSTEPEGRQLRQHAALVGDARSKHVVERRDAIGRDDQQMVAEIVHVADFSAARERQAREIGFQNDR